MSNHYHLLLETPEGNLSQIMRHINGAYTTYFNVKRKRAGHLFQGRFKAILVEVDDRLLTGCLAAINANARPCYIRKPYASYSHRPLAELFFMLLRSGERVLITLLSPF